MYFDHGCHIMRYDADIEYKLEFLVFLTNIQ